MFIVLIRAVLLYALVMFSLRLMGKRQIGELQPAELVITILISNIAALPIEDTDIPMALGMIPVLVLVAFEIAVSDISLRSKRFRSIISGKPVILVQNGVIDQTQLRKLRFSIDDLMESLRQNGVFDVREVQYAIVETNGNVSVLQKFAAQPVTAKAMHISGQDSDPPSVVVSDGQVIRSALAACGLTEEWLFRTLEKQRRPVADVFLMTADRKRNFYIVDKSAGKNRGK